MFEFHGWATIRVYDLDDADLDEMARRQRDALKQLKNAIAQADDRFSLFQAQTTSNGLIALTVHGLRNHRYEAVIDLFRWLAANLPSSYGLLYIHDDEDAKRGSDFTNAFRVWRVASGTCTELPDPFLSPYVPTVEAPFEFPPESGQSPQREAKTTEPARKPYSWLGRLQRIWTGFGHGAGRTDSTL